MEPTNRATLLTLGVVIQLAAQHVSDEQIDILWKGFMACEDPKVIEVLDPFSSQATEVGMLIMSQYNESGGLN